jgi:hypothetical protein
MEKLCFLRNFWYKLNNFGAEKSDFDVAELLLTSKNACSTIFFEKITPEIAKIHKKLQTTLKFYVNFGDFTLFFT